jgi:hypothetical protein
MMEAVHTSEMSLWRHYTPESCHIHEFFYYIPCCLRPHNLCILTL